MNRTSLENFRKKGPCTCGDVDCWSCASIGDFKFQWALAATERDIFRNQLERALEIAGGLAEHTNRTEEAYDWCTSLTTLVSEVRQEENLFYKPKLVEENAG